MAQTVVSIGSLITSDPDVQDGRSIIAGTGTTVHRIAMLYKQGYTADEIATDKDYLTFAQVHAALVHYYANKEMIDTDLTEDMAEYDRLAQEHTRALPNTS